MKNLFIYLFLGITFFAKAQNSTNTSIGANEKLTYTASYNMSGLLTNLAQVIMKTERVNTGKSNYLRLKCNAATYSKWDSFFKIRDVYEAYVSPKTLKPYLYKRDINEGGYIKKEKYVYSYKKKTIKATMQKKKEPNTTTLKMSSNTYDVVSTLYQIRNMDIDKAPVGSNQKITILFDRKPQTAYLKLLGKETITNKVIGTKECYKIAVSSNSNVLKGNNKNIIYLTADKNKVPVLIKFSIPAGTGLLTLTDASGLKN
ncbi:DUF3108 domain-containing protein [Aquimarina sp. MMG016]|uniref:DUF3108 domain-containing protein n=1 Tax=Aquimarina sp. MMG016 TaxID=2822690 RepID=UPI001B3A5E9D|nr:DUF3108 domain-containing protein [Aquimarina sp. MMG016]MBQ4821949.1 DUF3108 domain-containing protein [Aquimarina sp. MMG016]